MCVFPHKWSAFFVADIQCCVFFSNSKLSTKNGFSRNIISHSPRTLTNCATSLRLNHICSSTPYGFVYCICQYWEHFTTKCLNTGRKIIIFFFFNLLQIFVEKLENCYRPSECKQSILLSFDYSKKIYQLNYTNKAVNRGTWEYLQLLFVTEMQNN